MEFFQRAAGLPGKLGVFAGAFNPLTVAHLALARAARTHLGESGHNGAAEVVFVLPKQFPHKKYDGASFAARVEMLQAALAGEPGFSIAAADGGLFVDIADECRLAYGPDVALTFLCGRDAAERILGWDYGEADAVNKMLSRFGLLVAGRGGHLETTVPNCRHTVEMLALDGAYDHVSSTEVRERIARGMPWEHLTPEGARELVRRTYR